LSPGRAPVGRLFDRGLADHLRSRTDPYQLEQHRQRVAVLDLGCASYRALTFGAIPLGALLGGALGQILGLRPALLIGGIGLLLAPLIVVFSPLPTIRDLPRA
jgi:Transmembrane secretion effector